MVGIAVALWGGCKGGDEKDAGAAAEKKALEDAAAELRQPVALIASYLTYVRPADSKDRYAPKRQPDQDRASVCAANEIRHAANGARQKLRGDAAVTKDLTAALQAVSASCTDAEDVTAAEKCVAAVQKLDEALKKGEAASAAQGAAAKFPRVSPDAITEESKKAIAPFLKAKGPGDAMKAYVAKRGDANTSAADLLTACQAAVDEADQIAKAFEKADEPIRLIAVTRKMSIESQCGLVTATDTLRKDVNDCRKKAKTTDCKIACSKAKARVQDGVPAAVFLPLEKDVADVCEK